MKHNTFVLFLLFLHISFLTYGQRKGDYLLNGFASKVSGDEINYHSSISGADNALIVRATDGKYSMEWISDTVPHRMKESHLTLVWLAGLGSSPGLADMQLRINDRDKVEFRLDGRKKWTEKTAEGIELSFQSDFEDQHGDNFGFMFLRIPVSRIKKAAPVKLQMTGGANAKTSWYMTFQMPARPGLTVRTYPALIRENGRKLQLAAGKIMHFGAPLTAYIYVNNKLIKKQQLQFGANNLQVGLDEVSQNTQLQFKLVAGDFVQDVLIEQRPLRKWQVNLVQHSHTDIGYTRSQTEILGEHLRYIDYALDYCDLTDSYPDNAKFRWTCEASWAVDEYLKSRPASQVARLKKRVQEGRIEITSMYFNFDELPEEQVLAASLQPLKRFKAAGFETRTAMQNDVNGIAWCMNDFYKDLGVKYLNMGTHGHRALICFEKPTLFWWESPSGNRMLAYRGEHYMTGNITFEMEKPDLNNFAEKVLGYLHELDSKGYEFDEISIQHSGYLTDNSPPSTRASGLIKAWNEKYLWPRLKTATATGFFESMEKKYADRFPVYRGAWPDWWTDGFGASAREVAAGRNAQSDLTANTGGLSMAKLQGLQLPPAVEERIDLVNNALLFFTEHTTGYSESVREPYHFQTMEQRAIKESYAWEAYRRAKMIGEETLGVLQQNHKNEAMPSLLVYNTLNWKRDGLVQVYIDHQLVSRNQEPVITDSEGRVCQAQVVSRRSDGTYWAVWVTGVPAFGFKKLRIKTREATVPQIHTLPQTVLENQWYRLTLNTSKGTIESWFDKELNRELLDREAAHGMGEFIYERLGNRYQMEQKRLDDFKRFSFDSVLFDSYIPGPVWSTIRMKGKTAASYEGYDTGIEIKLYTITKRVELAYSIVKKPIVEPEGIYIAFPFKLEGGKHFCEVQGGEMEAGKDQIPGSSNDWNTQQKYTVLRSKDAQIVLGSPEIPLVQFGGINTGRYRAGAIPASTHLYSWPMNNYWVTNFNPDQRGEHRWMYFLTSSGDTTGVFASRTGWESRIPMLTRVLPGGGTGDRLWEQSFLGNWPENVLLVNAQPYENSILIQVRETGGKTADLTGLTLGTGAALRIERVNGTGELMQPVSAQLKARENAFYKLSW